MTTLSTSLRLKTYELFVGVMMQMLGSIFVAIVYFCWRTSQAYSKKFEGVVINFKPME